MTRKEKLALRQHQSTRQLMGMQGIASHGITTSNSELVFFLIRPDNLSVLSSEGTFVSRISSTNKRRFQ